MQRVLSSQRRRATGALVASIAALGSLSGLPRFLESNVAGGSELSSTADASAARATFQLSEEFKGSISGRTSGANGRVTLTALRYAPFGDSWIVTQFANVMQERPGAFELAGLPSGLWVITARDAAPGGARWGRSELIQLGPLRLGPLRLGPLQRDGIPQGAVGESADVSIELETYRVSVHLDGISKSQLGRAQLSMEWVQSDRFQADGDEFLDSPGPLGQQPDSFQVFGSLECAGAPWMAGELEQDGQEFSDWSRFDAGLDPFGLECRHQGWISPCPLGSAALPLPGPGLVTIRLHGAAGLWHETVATVEVGRGSSTTRIMLRADRVGAGPPIAPCSTALAVTSRAGQR